MSLNSRRKAQVERVSEFYPYYLTNLEYHLQVQARMIVHLQVRLANQVHWQVALERVDQHHQVH